MFTVSVWDRLLVTVERPAPESAKRAITRDLESLLNTRVAQREEELAAFPHCRNSIVNFGLADFAQLCLTSSEDRQDICARLAGAIERHEPRLTKVQVRLLQKAGVVNRLDFLISAQFRTPGSDERIQFDAVLERSRLQYSVR
jgi:type VI secretion system protein ImpF